MSTTPRNGARVGPDATQIMLQKNDRIREKFVKRMKKLGKDEERCTEERSRQVGLNIRPMLPGFVLTNYTLRSCIMYDIPED